MTTHPLQYTWNIYQAGEVLGHRVNLCEWQRTLTKYPDFLGKSPGRGSWKRKCGRNLTICVLTSKQGGSVSCVHAKSRLSREIPESLFCSQNDWPQPARSSDLSFPKLHFPMCKQSWSYIAAEQRRLWIKTLFRYIWWKHQRWVTAKQRNLSHGPRMLSDSVLSPLMCGI